MCSTRKTRTRIKQDSVRRDAEDEEDEEDKENAEMSVELREERPEDKDDSIKELHLPPSHRAGM